MFQTNYMLKRRKCIINSSIQQKQLQQQKLCISLKLIIYSCVLCINNFRKSLMFSMSTLKLLSSFNQKLKRHIFIIVFINQTLCAGINEQSIEKFKEMRVKKPLFINKRLVSIFPWKLNHVILPVNIIKLNF